MLEIIGLIGSFSTWPPRDSLCIFAVPYNLPGDDPVGYNYLYSFGEKFDLIFCKTLCTFLSVAFVGSELGLFTNRMSYYGFSIETSIGWNVYD